MTLKTDRLNCDTVNVTPITVDWSEGYGETWEPVLPDVDGWTLDDCRGFLVDYGSEHGDDADLDELRGFCRDLLADDARESFEPAMNYAYPLPGVDRETAARLVHELNTCCVVEIDGELYLALTGGGMDLSWEICESYIKLGCMPPLHFCNLPRMAGRGKSNRDRAIINACRSSCGVAAGWAEGTSDHLKRLSDD